MMSECIQRWGARAAGSCPPQFRCQAALRELIFGSRGEISLWVRGPYAVFFQGTAVYLCAFPLFAPRTLGFHLYAASQGIR